VEDEAQTDRPPVVAYATFSLRVRALVIDFAILSTTMALIFVLSLFAEDMPGSGRVFLAAIFGIGLFYEPILVWRYGATIGHRRANIRVVSDRTQGKPTFLMALARFWIKSVLGLPSFVTMAFTRRHQALHDAMTRTTVQIKDLATASYYVTERELEPVDAAQLAPVWRRIAIILAYSALAYGAMSIVGGVAESHGCAVYNECTATDRATFTLLGLVWLAAEIALVVQGWRGRLWGISRG
jgi:uncharacterized RDD family membrane protein YckC